MRVLLAILVSVAAGCGGRIDIVEVIDAGVPDVMFTGEFRAPLALSAARCTHDRPLVEGELLACELDVTGISGRTVEVHCPKGLPVRCRCEGGPCEARPLPVTVGIRADTRSLGDRGVEFVLVADDGFERVRRRYGFPVQRR